MGKSLRAQANALPGSLGEGKWPPMYTLTSSTPAASSRLARSTVSAPPMQWP